MASLVNAKDKVFITQTKLLYEVTWKTVMQIAKKHAVSVLIVLPQIPPNSLFDSNSTLPESCRDILATIVPRAAPGTDLYGLVLVDTRRTAVSAPGARDGLLLPRGHQGLLPGRTGRAHSVPEEHQQRQQCRVEQRNGEGGH